MDDFLEYIRDVRGYSDTSVTTYEIALRQMLEVSEWFEEEGEWILDITVRSRCQRGRIDRAGFR